MAPSRFPQHHAPQSAEVGTEWLPAREAEDVLRCLCGRWQDQKGSKYGLSIDGSGSLAVCTTRPSGEVIRTNSLIRVERRGDMGRVVWGRKGARFVYTIGKLESDSLVWQCCNSAQFSWERLPGDAHDIKAADVKDVVPPATLDRPPLATIQAPRCGADFRSHRARLRKEFQQRRHEQRKSVGVSSHSAGGSADERTSESNSVCSGSSSTWMQAQPQLVAIGGDGPLHRNAAGLPTKVTLPAATQHHAQSLPPWCLAEPWSLPLPSSEDKLYWNQGSSVDCGIICKQLEFYFSDANLSHDSYLQSLMMPHEGWVHLAHLLAFPRMISLGADDWSIRQAILESNALEMDATACFVRIRSELQCSQGFSTLVCA